MSTPTNNISDKNDTYPSTDFNEIEISSAIESNAAVLSDDDLEEDFLPSSQEDKDTFTRFYQTYEKPHMPFSAIQQQVVNKSGSVETVKAISGSVFDRHYAPLVGPLTKVAEVIKGNCLATKKELRRVSKELANTPQFLNDHIEKKPFTPGDWLLLAISTFVVVFLAIISPLTMKAHFEGTHAPLFTDHPWLTYCMGLVVMLGGLIVEAVLLIMISERFKKIVMACLLIAFIPVFGIFVLALGSMTRKNGLSGFEKMNISASESQSQISRGGNFTQKWMFAEISLAALSLSCLVHILNKRYYSVKIKNPYHREVKNTLDKLHVDFHDRANMLGSAEGRLQMIQHERDLFIAEAVTAYHYALQERA